MAGPRLVMMGASGLVVKSNVAIVGPWVRFPAGAWDAGGDEVWQMTNNFECLCTLCFFWPYSPSHTHPHLTTNTSTACFPMPTMPFHCWFTIALVMHLTPLAPTPDHADLHTFNPVCIYTSSGQTYGRTTAQTDQNTICLCSEGCSSSNQTLLGPSNQANKQRKNKHTCMEVDFHSKNNVTNLRMYNACNICHMLGRLFMRVCGNRAQT